jgi:hypothetical protein
MLELVGDGFLKPVLRVRMLNSRKRADLTELHLSMLCNRRSALFRWTLAPVMYLMAGHQFRHGLFQLKLGVDRV